MSTPELPVLGVGLGYRPAFAAELLSHRDQIDFLEITVEHYLDAGFEKQRELARLRKHFTLIPHGLNLSLGSAQGLDPRYLEKLAAFVEALDPPWWSEHVSFTLAGGVDIGHLTPLPFTREALDILCANITEVQRQIRRPLILENITYLLDLGGEMPEAAFLAELAARTGCGLLLDITNLHVNAANHGYQIAAFLAQLPLEQVVQLHFVGGHRDRDLLIDSHSQATPAEIWQLMESVLARAPVKGIILERDENFPSFADLLAELDRARTLGRKCHRWD
ncbi:MAG: DUF692 domain-containing protein [Candidatus Sericytochromatia bacterium]